MARYIGPVCRLCRREGVKLFLKGDRCNSFRCSMEKKATVPGQHGQGRRRFKKHSEYGIQLREKQKAKRIFGILEKQFRRYFSKAEGKAGVTGENLLMLIERRLDNVVYKLGLASSRRFARQLIVHKHFLVNGKVVNKPAFSVREGEIISVKEKSKEMSSFKVQLDKKEDIIIPDWLERNKEILEGKIIRLPIRDDIDIPVNEQLIVELYSK